VGHLAILNVSQLQSLHREHGIKAPGKLRAQLVESLKARLGSGKEKKPKAKPKRKPGEKTEQTHYAFELLSPDEREWASDEGLLQSSTEGITRTQADAIKARAREEGGLQGGKHPPIKATDPRLIGRFGERLHVKDESHPAVQQHLRDLTRVPPSLSKAVQDARVEIHVGTGGVSDQNHLSYLQGVQPRGWEEGATWDNVAGAYVTSGKKVVACTGRGSSASIALHEYGHAVGDVLGWDGSDELIEHHKRLHEKLTSYLQQDGPGGLAGRQELFAEGTAAVLRSFRTAAVAQYDEPFVAWLEDILRNARTARPPIQG